MKHRLVEYTCLCGKEHSVIVLASDKRSDFCQKCHRLWDISDDGNVRRSPLPEGTEVVEQGVRYVNGQRPTINVR